MSRLGALVIVMSTIACSASHHTFDDGPADSMPADSPSQSDVVNPTLEDAGPISDSAPDGTLLAMNLIPNGDFEQGNMLFGSDYAYATLNHVEGEYTVGNNPQAFNGALVKAGDHTSGSTMMFIGNGKSTPDRVWFTMKLAVKPNTQYFFEAFVMNLFGYDMNTPVGPSKLSFYANGALLGTRMSSKVGVWEGLSTTWSSDAATSVDLELVNAETQAIGNDFAVDDIYLGTISTVDPPH
jgi:hypothetical protein